MKPYCRVPLAILLSWLMVCAQQPAAPPPAQQPAAPAQPGMVLNLQNASLVEVIELLASRLKINYILDPRVKGTVSISTYGEIRDVDTRQLLEIVLRMNGFTMVQLGEIYRIVPVTDAPRLPITPQVDQKEFPSDDRMVLNMVFLKYATVAEVQKLLQPFLGEGAQMTVYEPANLLLLLDNSRNMRRTMELIAMFDSDVLAGQRVRLFEVRHGRPSDLARELDQVMRAVSLGGDRASPVRFLPIDRINTLVAIAPNPGVFDQVEIWLKKLDIEPKTTTTGTRNYVYRLRYGRAETLAGAIMQLYLGLMFPMFGMGYGGYGGGYGMGGYGMGGYGGGMYSGGILQQMMSGYQGMGGYPGMSGGMGMYGGGMGMYGGGAGAYGGAVGYPGYGQGYQGQQGLAAQPGQAGTAAGAGSATTQPTSPGGISDLTGSYLGAGYRPGFGLPPNMPRVIPNPFDNTLLIQSTPQDYEQIVRLIEQLDVAPRQILVEAKIYEVNMNGEFSSGVEAFLQRRTTPDARAYRGSLSTVNDSPVLRIDAGFLVGQSRELLAAISAAESTGRAKLVSAPSLIATDSIPATINVGDEVPTLAAQAVSGGIQSEGSSLFTQSVVNRQSGVTLNVMARANPSGIVTMVIHQDVSAPTAPPAGAAIPSPSFSRRAVNTQVTVDDGDTIAIGGIISESNTFSSAGIPVLHRVPILGGLFGSKIITKQRTELVIFMTPRVIHDTNMMREASDELRSKFKKLRDVEP